MLAQDTLGDVNTAIGYPTDPTDPTHHFLNHCPAEILPEIGVFPMLIQTDFSVSENAFLFFLTAASLDRQRLADGRCQNAWGQGTRGWEDSIPIKSFGPQTLLKNVPSGKLLVT